MTPEILRLSLENVDFRLPTQVTDDNSVVALKSLVFEPLLRWKPHGHVEPALFDNWNYSPDARTWRFHIRDNAVLHDGKPCDATAIVTYIEELLSSRDYFDMPWSYSRYFADTKFSAEDSRTVKVETSEPFVDILGIFCEFWPSRIDVHGKPVLGTGPFKVVEFERENGVGRAKLERLSPTRQNTPHTIVAIHEPDAAKRLQLLRDGEVDAALNLERAEDLDLINFDSSLRWSRPTSTLSVIYYLNCSEGVFTSPEARLAANLAVDNAALVEEVYRGLALPSATIVSPAHLGFPESKLKPINYDPKRARELLEGLDTSTPLVLRTPTYMPEHAQRISNFVAKSLREVGFEVEVKVERPIAQNTPVRLGSISALAASPFSTLRPTALSGS